VQGVSSPGILSLKHENSPLYRGLFLDLNKYCMEQNNQASPHDSTVDSGTIHCQPPKPGESQQCEVIPYEEPTIDPSKTGNKPKQLKAVEVLGYEVGRGKNKKIVFPEDVYKLAAIGCTDQDIATWFDIEYSTLRYNFSDIIAKGRQDLKMTLRKSMLKNALNGNAAIQIFLAKNMLGMSDNPVDSEENRPLPWTEQDL
jgi:hypothetical protein